MYLDTSIFSLARIILLNRVSYVANISFFQTQHICDTCQHFVILSQQRRKFLIGILITYPVIWEKLLKGVQVSGLDMLAVKSKISQVHSISGKFLNLMIIRDYCIEELTQPDWGIHSRIVMNLACNVIPY